MASKELEVLSAIYAEPANGALLRMLYRTTCCGADLVTGQFISRILGSCSCGSHTAPSVPVSWTLRGRAYGCGRRSSTETRSLRSLSFPPQFPIRYLLSQLRHTRTFNLPPGARNNLKLASFLFRRMRGIC